MSETTPQDDAAMYPASTGSVAGEPLGWAVVNKDGVAVRFAGSFLTLANAATQVDEIVPLYRSPPDWAFLNDEIATLRERLRQGFFDSGRLTDAEREAVDEIVRLRGALAELGACVRMAKTLDEAVASANRWSPMDMRAVALQGFHMVDLAWRKPPEVAQ